LSILESPTEIRGLGERRYWVLRGHMAARREKSCELPRSSLRDSIVRQYRRASRTRT